MGERLEVNLSRKVRCIQGTPKLVWKGIDGSSRRRSRYVDPLVVWVLWWVELRSWVVAVGDDLGDSLIAKREAGGRMAQMASKNRFGRGNQSGL